MTIKEQCEHAGITRTTYYWRKKRGLPLLDKPTQSRKSRPVFAYKYNGEWLTLFEIMRIENKPYNKVYSCYATKLPRMRVLELRAKGII